jgi:hypothetical protein
LNRTRLIWVYFFHHHNSVRGTWENVIPYQNILSFTAFNQNPAIHGNTNNIIGRSVLLLSLRIETWVVVILQKS